MKNYDKLTSKLYYCDQDAYETPVADNTGAIQPRKVERGIIFDGSKKAGPLIVMALGLLIMLCQWIIGLNIVTLIGLVYLCVVSALIAGGLIIKKRFYIPIALGYIFVWFGMVAFYIIAGADAGFGAWTNNITGAVIGDGWLETGGSFGARLLGNLLIGGPSVLTLCGIVILVYNSKLTYKLQRRLTSSVSLLLVFLSVALVFTMNLRVTPKVFDMSDGAEEYLNGVQKNADKNSPNVLVILMDDLGYGDTSYNGATAYKTPNIDWIAEEGVNFDNFYSAYSVCSPSRFALMTGRYPYRGYADNVMYPTVNSLDPFASTRVFNPIEMGANVDGMLGDEITIAEALKASGYATGAFGKWHLGDYGQYLPTNQGFDYFYGSHHVNDMNPFYYVREEKGEYTIDTGAKELDQREATVKIHNETSAWIQRQARQDNPFFAYYATPWPHAPIYAGEAFEGSTGAGIYADCIAEFDYYLGELFAMMDEEGVLDDTLIIFSSDNGPALQGSVSDLRGGKYTPYEGGQKVPCYMRYGNSELFEAGRTISAPASLIDIFPTLADICGVTGTKGKRAYLPSDVDRLIDGRSMLPLLKGEVSYIHTEDSPILHMKREQIKAVQYGIDKQAVLDTLPENERLAYSQLPLFAEQPDDYLSWKYFRRMTNDNPAFPNKVRKNWLICLTDDKGESYQRADDFPVIAKQLDSTMKRWEQHFKENRRGINADYYKK